ncbi:Phosphoacetylglucosamine Mutase [Maudiozyma exigua]|uniref:Phosphoacetylglucosamine mutase n=1 Tax=Maudiozyma exigua TaxID=34358 RepID=A0A9P7B3R6_MAUEX|nr:Phosphoacetylglucosamine Mutase [Kazachstania exigua]
MLEFHALKPLYDSQCQTRNYTYTYGTAGFRDHADVLDTVMFTTGIVAALRSLKHNGKFVGVMITASHNPPQDNGVKIIEPDGSMLLQDWEPIATKLANIASNESFDNLVNYIRDIIQEQKIDIHGSMAHIAVGMDSRESSPRLMNCLMSTLEPIFNAIVINHGMLTTPQLHYLTSCHNEEDIRNVSIETYNRNFQSTFKKLLNIYNIQGFNNCFDNLIVDCANGIGAPQFERFSSLLSQSSMIKFTNDNYLHPETLNESCGADFVKTRQTLPKGVPQEFLQDGNNNLYCSFDGDADRIVFYYIKDSKFHLLDGDKIATLFAKFLKELLTTAQIPHEKIKLGIVQTAYANGSSTNYVKTKLNCPTSCTKTGVKHLHHEAQTAYDIGIYFEANGHGTILFSNKFYQQVQSCIDNIMEQPNGDLEKDERWKACETLLLFSRVINQTVGDAIADLLGVIATLLITKSTPDQWDNEYTDLPNLLSKIVVPDRNLFKTTDQERKLTSPPGLQAKMDTLINKIENGRAFVRASGTEDAVRIYCEGSSINEVKKLSQDIADLILKDAK